MRLMRLEFEGVGSFADRMEIDFEALGTAGLFLIEGPTGSGKSTILDAVVFALYGTPAGSDSDLGRLDSHLRDRGREPFVELDFEVEGARYRIHRTPRHERDKRRGSGTKVDDGGVSLVRLHPDMCDVSHRAKEIGDWVVEHIGLTKQQFVSTIVLAQGEFANFLDADTKERTPILEKVFGTEFYQRVEDQLVAMRKSALALRSEAQASLTGALDRCLGLLSLDGQDDPVAAIDAELVRLRDEAANAEEESRIAGTSLREAERNLAAARDLVQRQQRKRTLRQRQLELAAAHEHIQRLREAVSEHERALPVMAALRAWREAEREEHACVAQAEDDQQALAALGEQPASQERLSDLATLTGQLREPLAMEGELPQLQASLPGLRQVHAQAVQAVQRLTARDHDLAEELERTRQVRRDSAVDADRMTELQLRQSELVKQIAAWEQVHQQEAALTEARENRDRAQAAVDEVQSRLAAARDGQLQNMAVNLAAQLRPGDPCAVCGSKDHPAPARNGTAAEGEDPEKLAARVEQLRAAWQAAREAHNAIEVRIGLLRTGLPGESEDLAVLLQAVEQELTRLREAAEHVEATAERADALERELTQVRSELTDSSVALEQQRSQLAAAEDNVRAVAQTVTVARGEFATVHERLQRLTRIRQMMTQALGSQDRRTSATVNLRRASEVLTATLDSVGIADARTAEAAILDEAVAEGHRRAIEVHDAHVSEVAAALRDLDAVDLDTVTDVEALAELVSQRREAHEAAQQALGRLEHTLGEARPRRAQVQQCQQRLARVADETAAVIRVADLATASRGEVIHRVRLSSFVLMRRFESVVEAANDRLDVISEGRYQLQVETQGLDKRGQAGLDLLVADQRTERCRSTKSLSGGERFYVSLALALGLADVVRSESGGVSLGTLFIDEGFGSLDSEVLEEVMDMLEQVRAGEDRVIGLVSHVDILKQRIDPRISVRRDPTRAGVSTLEVRV